MKNKLSLIVIETLCLGFFGIWGFLSLSKGFRYLSNGYIFEALLSFLFGVLLIGSLIFITNKIVKRWSTLKGDE